MQSKIDINKIIFEAFDDINQDLEENEKLKKSTKTPIFGSDSSLDSIDLVNLIVLIEQKLEDRLGHPIILSDDKAMSQKTSPFKNVETLEKYISSLINK